MCELFTANELRIENPIIKTKKSSNVISVIEVRDKFGLVYDFDRNYLRFYVSDNIYYNNGVINYSFVNPNEDLLNIVNSFNDCYELKYKTKYESRLLR